MTLPASLPKPKKLSGRLLLRRVVGDSMLPGLCAGQIVLVVPWRTLRVGDMVIVRHEGREKIKRIAQIAPARIYVLGDNPAASTDSRTFGWLERSSVLGKVAWPRLPAGAGRGQQESTRR